MCNVADGSLADAFTEIVGIISDNRRYTQEKVNRKHTGETKKKVYFSYAFFRCDANVRIDRMARVAGFEPAK